MFRKKRFAAGKKAALSVSYDTANQKSTLPFKTVFAPCSTEWIFHRSLGRMERSIRR